MNSLTSVGSLVVSLARLINDAGGYIFGAIILAVVIVILLRVIADALKLNPFGKFAYYATKPANVLIGNMRQSRFYYPLKRAFGFDPAILMILIATAILGYVVYTMIGYLNVFLIGTGNTLIAFGLGQPLTAGKYLIGTLLIVAIFFLLSLMLIIFVNSLFGLLKKAAGFAYRRIAPLLHIFEFGGMFAGWSFLILWIALTFAAQAVMAIFL
ncbi:MAG: hypothetical protein JST84_29665 [Acidobacteria bacterium]|nr:hypothetical protein [Acidobacteriota bacterium]